MAKKTWKQKYETGSPQVEVLERPMMGMAPGARLYITTPRIMDASVRLIPYGQTKELTQIRAELAHANGADATCALTSGIFMRIIAELALESLAGGAALTEVSPFWRVVKPNSPLANKLSCGAEHVAALRRAEGIVD
ncbi:MAG: hypothetical protein JNM85_06105 [Chthonomonas sp.]|nr:hypothetical protein [Chthonomonas sp.]